MHILHQVKSPRHGEDGVKSAQYRDEGASLDRASMDEVGLDFAGQTSKV